MAKVRVHQDFFFSILCFTSIIIVYNNYTVQNNILIKIDGVVYSCYIGYFFLNSFQLIVEISNI